MARRRPPIPHAGSAALMALAVVLSGCAEIHHGTEAVARLGGSAPPAAADVADDDVGTVRPAVRTVRPRGAPRAQAGEAAAERAPTVVAAAVPAPRDIFDFHPRGAQPDSWREPFAIDTSDGPLAADVRRSTAELKAYRADMARTAKEDAAKAQPARAQTARMEGARIDPASTGTTRIRCGEAEVATGQPGCAVPRPPADAGPTKP